MFKKYSVGGPNNLTYTFTLRDGLMFHDGAPVLRTENLDKTCGSGGILQREQVVHAAKAVNTVVRRGKT